MYAIDRDSGVDAVSRSRLASLLQRALQGSTSARTRRSDAAGQEPGQRSDLRVRRFRFAGDAGSAAAAQPRNPRLAVARAPSGPTPFSQRIAICNNSAGPDGPPTKKARTKRACSHRPLTPPRSAPRPCAPATPSWPAARRSSRT
ncbi:DUF6053 domain-containing protein [Lysobacter enzymogenes]|uniref:DUF6053 domain-containing protein n=1 Tax=Lysobacter enzymogenes TaxID=69 RepID=UPI003D188B23